MPFITRAILGGTNGKEPACYVGDMSEDVISVGVAGFLGGGE